MFILKHQFHPRLLLISLTAIIVLATQVYAASQWKLWAGLGLTALGTYLAVDGFREVVINEWDEKVIDQEWDEDISNPQVDISNWSWSEYIDPLWCVHPCGVVQNTGNVPLKYVKIRYYFYDEFGNILASGCTYLDTYFAQLPVAQSDTWSGSPYYHSPEPICGGIEVEDYDYDKLYEHHVTYKNIHHVEKGPKSEVEGWCGVTSASVGIYFLVDWLTDIPRVTSFLDRNDLDIKVVNHPGSLTLLATKAL